MIERVILQNYCGFQNFALDFDDLTVLAGPNNGGKTSILKAIQICITAMRKATVDQNKSHPDLLKNIQRQNFLSILTECGFTDLSSVFFEKDQSKRLIIELYFRESNQLSITITSHPTKDAIDIKIDYDNQPSGALDDETRITLWNCLKRIDAEFVSPPATISAREEVLTFPQLSQFQSQGKHAETWRNRFHWLSEGTDIQSFNRVVEKTNEYFADTEIMLPRRGKEEHVVEVIYSQNGVNFDIASAGSGVRTILSLVSIVELSKAPILLFDEPDSHLHSSIQREVLRYLQDVASCDRQVILSTHAPDLIEEAPIDSLVWIDGSENAGKTCDEVGHALIELGAINHTTAIASINANSILFLEGKNDISALKIVLARCNKNHILENTIVEKLKGIGNAKKLPDVLKIIRILRNQRLAIAAILDTDFTQPIMKLSVENDGDVLYIRLPCKELENLLLVSPECISKAVEKKALRRASRSDEGRKCPSVEQIKAKIIQFSKTDQIKKHMTSRWIICRANHQSLDLHNENDFRKVEAEFSTNWNDDEWRVRCCPGKKVLRNLKTWIQSEYHISVKDSKIFECYEPSLELIAAFEKLGEHFSQIDGSSNRESTTVSG